MEMQQYSMDLYWKEIFSGICPALSFKHSNLNFEEWAEAARNKLMELMGEFPEKTSLDAEILSTESCELFERRKVVFKSERDMAVPCYVLIPYRTKEKQKLPAILCSHGHGKYGKEPVAGIKNQKKFRDEIEKMNYNYGEQLAKEGFVTLVPDLRGFGERKAGYEEWKECEVCNFNYMRGSLIKKYPLSMNVWDMKRCIDYLESMPEVDPSRIGMMGLSLGGTMTTFTSALDKRIRAADIVGYINPIFEFGIRHKNMCGSQVVPGLYQYFDTYDIAGMIAPRPLLIEMGKKDECFLIEDMEKGFQEVAVIYHAAAADHRLQKDVHEGGHAFSGKKAADFFRKYLCEN